MAGGKILVFEDNTSIQLLLKVFFQRKGFETVVLGDGTDAVAQVRKHQPALILMDFIMPGKDGFEAVVELRAAGIATPIVMLTSKDLAADRERVLKAGANAYLIKPFNPKELEGVIAPLLTR